MSTANKRKGSKWETDLVNYLRDKGYTAERLARTGRNDEGDVALLGHDWTYVIEAKNAARLELAAWLKEADVEAENYRHHRDLHADPIPVVVVKRRNSSTSKAYVVMDLETWLAIIS